LEDYTTALERIYHEMYAKVKSSVPALAETDL
jgi:hypothetical protein